MYFALDGVACCYKTSTLKELQTEGCDVEFTSFAAFMERITDFPSKLELASFWYGMIRLGSSHRVGCVYDRHPASALLYQIIHNDPNIEDVHLFKLFNMFKLLMHNWKMIIVVPKNTNLVVQRMEERENRLDKIDINYVNNQTRIFKAFAKYFDVMIAEVDHEDPYSSIQSIKMLIHTALYGNIVVMGVDKKLADKPYPFDAGIDLHIKETVTCEKGQSTRVKLKERIIIPAGYVGFMYPRSSTALNFGDIRTGVIPFYSDELSCPFVADKTVLLEEGQRIAQIIIMRSTFPPIVHCPDVKLIHMENFRGASGYGSSGI